MTRPVASVPALRLYATYLEVLERNGFPRVRALEALRVLLAYAYGYSAAELTWTTLAGTRATAPRRPRTPDEIFADVPAGLIKVATDVCRGAGHPAHFALGLDLMLRGLDTSDRQP